MKKDTIVQFVCFETALEMDAFVPHWEHFVKPAGNKSVVNSVLQQAMTKTKFKYVSLHKGPPDEFQYLFMKGRQSEHFPEIRVKVVQAGGYTPLQIGSKNHTDQDAVKILVSITNAQTDLEPLKDLDNYRYLNIYQAYYESSLYAYILEYFVEETLAAGVLQQLKAIAPGTEMAMYRECMVPAI